MKVARGLYQFASSHWFFMSIVGLFTIFYVWGIAFVPFHPDESTYIFMSSDFEKLLHDPYSMTWNPELENDPVQRYRELDAPLTRYIIGFSRLLTHLPALPADWDWSKTWQQNQQAGAFPSVSLLFTSRLAVTLLLPVSLILIYLSGKMVEDHLTGLLAAMLLGSNALILLHARRAMAESALVLGITLALWSFLQGQRRPWLAGLATALAFTAKHSAIALLPAGVLAVLWVEHDTQNRLQRWVSNLGQYLAAFVLLTFALNPLIWKDPLGAIQASLNAREDLLSRQTSDTIALAPEQVLQSPGKRMAVLVANLFVMPPSFEEVGNYQAQTSASELQYSRIPGTNLGRGIFGGGIMLSLTLFGLVLAGLQIRKGDFARKRNFSLLVIMTGLQAIALLVAVTLPWQRYVVPLIPYTCLWSAYGAAHILKLFKPETESTFRQSKISLNG